MASLPIQPLDALLGAIPSLPRPVLARLTQRMIERMDEMDPDPDLEDDDPAGGNSEDEGEEIPSAWAMKAFEYGADQRQVVSRRMGCLFVRKIEQLL